MLMITLQRIKDCRPCGDGWKKLLKSKGGTKADMNLTFPLTDVLDSNDLEATLWCLNCFLDHHNLWKKYSVWCARQVQHLMKDQRSIDALNVSWRHSEGLATDDELDAAWNAAWNVPMTGSYSARAALWATRTMNTLWTATDAALAARDAASPETSQAALESAWNTQEQKLREILTAGEWVEC